jgi:hypothetical protein
LTGIIKSVIIYARRGLALMCRTQGESISSNGK